MTRINCVPPEELSGPHLVAEYRELPRVFGLIRRAKPGKAPQEYVMGQGHVRFFYDKAGWLLQRQRSLIEEMKRRGYKPRHTDPEALTNGLELGSWEPDERALAVNRARLVERGAS
mgnify:CR=1 FL=1